MSTAFVRPTPPNCADGSPSCDASFRSWPGPRQVGKTTLVGQVLARRGAPCASCFSGLAPFSYNRRLGESLAGRFEVVHLPHWSFSEMHEAFGFSIEDYLFYGGYAGAATLIDEPERWRRYVTDSLIEPTIARDVLLLTRVDKPALLRRLFDLGCRYSGQILSYTKMLGQLHDAGNVTKLAHYLELLSAAGMLTGLQKYSGKAARQRGSSPKLQVLNTALMTAQSAMSAAEARCDTVFRGRLVESAVGAHLANAAASGECALFYWLDRNHEVDFVVQRGKSVTAIEVKSGRPRDNAPACLRSPRPTRRGARCRWAATGSRLKSF